LLTFALAALLFTSASAAEPRVGFSEKDITPEVDPDKPAVWMAGYGYGRKAKGVHDPLLVRAMVLEHEGQKIAIGSVDLVGLQYDAVQRIREELKDFKHVTIGSTHNHEGPDVIGIWGPTPFQRGVNEAYLATIVKQTVAAIREAETNCTAATASYGTAQDDSLMDDHRLPLAKDGVLRAIKFIASDNKAAGILVQWNCHPEAMGPHNKLLTADFPASTVAWLKEKYQCPVLYMSGAVGGLMSPPDERIKDEDGKLLGEGDFEYTKRLGEETARLASRAIESARPIGLTPLSVASKQVAVPVENLLYKLARQAGVLKREGRLWMGDAEKFGEVLTEWKQGADIAVVTEVSCLRLGELTIVNLPCEIYPELVYGKFQEPVEPHADFPDAPLEPTVVSLVPSDKWLLFGLASDEIGYVLPKRQWDDKKPFCYGRTKAQYGEINSCGPETAPIIMKALADCIRQLEK
jgi:hypothetical protein